MTKGEQYKTFAFPNKLTPLETYHYYLLEFDVIPKKLPADKITEIFIHAAKDYVEGFLNTPTFSLITFHLMIYI